MPIDVGRAELCREASIRNNLLGRRVACANQSGEFRSLRHRAFSSKNVDVYLFKRGLSAASTGQNRQRTRRPECDDGIVELTHRSWDQSVEAPSALSAIADQAGVLQHLEVKGEARLGRLEVGDQIADATLTVAERLDDPQTGLIGERVRQLGSSVARSQRLNGQLTTLINNF